MKNSVTVLALLLFGMSAHAEISTIKVDCKGTSGGQDVFVKTNEAVDALKVAIVQTGSEPAVPEDFFWVSYPITGSSAMFPISSLSARYDFRPVDGSLVELDLSILTMSPPGPDGTHPATLTRKSTWYDRMSGREAEETKQFEVNCKLEDNNF